MTATSSKEIFDGQQGSGDEKYLLKCTRTFLVQTDSQLDGPLTVLATGALVGPNPVPTRWSIYVSGNDVSGFLYAKNANAVRVSGSMNAWHVSVEYDSSLDPFQSDPNPLNRTPIDNWSNAAYQRVADKDTNGKPVANAVGQAFDPLPEVDDSRPVLVYQRNESSYPTTILTYQDCINSDTFLGFAPKTAKVHAVTAAKQYENGYRFYAVTYEFHFRYDTWVRQIANRGTQFRPVAGANAIDIPPGFREPVWLRKDGTKAITDTEGFTYLDYHLYREVPFGPLNIVIY